MDPKLMNYSKLQIPILNGAAHSYVIMPALLSQIDVTNYTTCESTEIETTTSFPNIYFTNDNTTAHAYDTDQQQNHLSNSKILITSGSHGFSTYNNDDANTDDSTSKSQSTVDKIKNKKSSKRLNTKRVNKLSLQLHHEPNQSPDLEDSSELLELNSPISISKFIFKETDCMQHQQQQQQQNLLHNINPDNLLNDNHMVNGGQHVHSLESYNDLNDPNADFIGKPLVDLSPNSSDEANNCDSVTYIVNCPTLSDIDLNHMMNCFIALNKLNDADNIDCKLKCIVCSQQFCSLTELCEHKNNDFCNELSEFIQSDDEDHSTNNICDEDDDDDIDLDIDDDVQLSVSVPKKKTRRKYIKNKYNSSSSLICDECKKTCRTKAELLVHIHKHAGNEPECWECGKKCASFSNLVSHVQLHTGEKPYTCQFCSKQFTQDAHLTRHLRLHTGERPFICNICGKTYKDYSYYKTHERIHRGERLYKCNYCNKEYYDASYYKKHVRLHTGEKPYMCTVCGKQFHRSDYLKLHSFSHTDERPFYCNLCGKGFKMNYNLKIHLKNHETESPILDKSFNEDEQQNMESSGELTTSEINALLNSQSYKIEDLRTLTFNLITDKETHESQINNLISINSAANTTRTDLDSLNLNFT